MPSFFFEGVKKAPNGDFVPSFHISESGNSRIRERWGAFQLTGEDGEPIVGQERESILNRTVLNDALWQFWLSNDLRGDQGKSSWQQLPMDEKLPILTHCVHDGVWWMGWAIDSLGFHSWPWQKRLAFERTAVRESINAESPTPATAAPDRIRREVIEKMVSWHQEFDLGNQNLSPHNIPESYAGLEFETI